jgi:translation elongation factor P/translation initiation factor 5A
MIEVNEQESSGSIFPVARKAKDNGMIVIFWEERRATVVRKGKSTHNVGYESDTWIVFTDDDTWEPIDVHIYIRG